MIKLSSFDLKQRVPRPTDKWSETWTYTFRYKVPFVYADGIWRFVIFGHPDRGFHATINGTNIRRKFHYPQKGWLDEKVKPYKTAAGAAQAIKRRLLELSGQFANINLTIPGNSAT
jgi:hypothetical protein